MAKKLTCPKWLNEEASLEWKRVYKLLVKENIDFTEKDIKALEMYSCSYAAWKANYLYCLKHGNTFIVNESGYEQVTPQYANKNKEEEKAMKWMKELLITPASRNKNNNSNNNKPIIYNKEDAAMETIISHV